MLAAFSPVLRDLLLLGETETIMVPFKSDVVRKMVAFAYKGKTRIDKVCKS